jgi:phenylacetate-CoA ligase
MNFPIKFLDMIFRPDIYNSYLKQKKIRKLPLDEIQKIQWNRLKELLQFVYDHSDFYHEFFRSVNLKPDDIISYNDFIKLPFTDKKILKENYKKVILKDTKNKDYVISYTSGSTGEPFSFLLDKKREHSSTTAAFMLNKEMVGIDPFEKINELMIKAKPENEIKNLTASNKKGILYLLKNHFFSETIGINSLDIKKENIDAINKIIKRYNIMGIYGYSSNIFYLAKLFEMYKFEIQLKYVILIAEGLLKQQKDFISNTFNCPVYMDYGASECMRMGFECNQLNGYHMDLYNYYFEYLNDHNEPCKLGENANIIVTNLNNYIFPLLRYRIGDQCRLTKEKCSCDVNYPLVSQITGRKSDIIRTPYNDEISLSNFAVFFEYLYEYIIQYQIIVDEKVKEIIIKIIPTQKFNQETMREIKEQIANLINNSMNIKIELVEKIPFEKHGKTKSLIIK